MGGRGVSRIPGWLWDWTCSRWRAGICPSVSRSQGQLRLGVTSMSVRAGGFSSCEPQSLSRLTLTLLRDTVPSVPAGPSPCPGRHLPFLPGQSMCRAGCASPGPSMAQRPVLRPHGFAGSGRPTFRADCTSPPAGGNKDAPPQWPEHSWSGPRPRALRVPCQASQPWVQRPHSCATSRQKEGALFCLEKADYHR